MQQILDQNTSNKEGNLQEGVTTLNKAQVYSIRFAALMGLSPLIGQYLRRGNISIDADTTTYLRTGNIILIMILCGIFLLILGWTTRLARVSDVYYMYMGVLVSYVVIHLCILYATYIQSHTVDLDVDTPVYTSQKSQRWQVGLLILGLTFNSYILLAWILVMIFISKVPKGINKKIEQLRQSYQAGPEERCRTTKDTNKIPKITFTLFVMIWIGLHIDTERYTILISTVIVGIVVYRYWIVDQIKYIPIVSDVYNTVHRHVVK